MKELQVLINALELRDIYTQGHSQRVAQYVKNFANFLKIDKEEILFIAGLLHDVGKVGIPDIVLLKPGKLDNDEIDIVKYHSVLSFEIVKEIDKNISKIIRHHHENWDGTGYPDGLIGEEIPYYSRILSICDVFDALTTPRIYRKAMDLYEALKIMDSMKNKFEPSLYKSFKIFIKDFGIIEQKLDLLTDSVLASMKNNVYFLDTLTKLLNRRGVLAILQKASSFGLYMNLVELNIKKFKEYNRIFGLKKGDEILKMLSKEITSFFKAIPNIEEPANKKVFAGREKSDKFLLISFGCKEEYLKYKIDLFIKNIKKDLNIDLTCTVLIKTKKLNSSLLNEIGYII